jgi:hypothetical protein
MESTNKVTNGENNAPRSDSATAAIDHREEDPIPLENETKIESTESAAYDALGYSYPIWRKWQILYVIFKSRYQLI